jgi:hypothetical protein
MLRTFIILAVVGLALVSSWKLNRISLKRQVNAACLAVGLALTPGVALAENDAFSGALNAMTTKSDNKFGEDQRDFASLPEGAKKRTAARLCKDKNALDSVGFKNTAECNQAVFNNDYAIVTGEAIKPLPQKAIEASSSSPKQSGGGFFGGGGGSSSDGDGPPIRKKNAQRVDKPLSAAQIKQKAKDEAFSKDPLFLKLEANSKISYGTSAAPEPETPKAATKSATPSPAAAAKPTGKKVEDLSGLGSGPLKRRALAACKDKKFRIAANLGSESKCTAEVVDGSYDKVIEAIEYGVGK